MQPKNTFFCKKSTLNCHGKLIDLSSPTVMGILNVTPDSFFDGAQLSSIDDILKKVGQMLEDGVGIIDVGGMSSRPGAAAVSEEEEKKRIMDPIEQIARNFPNAIISVDTYRSAVAELAIQAGASIINDITGGQMDSRIYEVAGAYKAPYILMHMQGSPETMQQNPSYEDVVLEITRYFAEKVELLKKAKVNDIVIDPGFGFGKSIRHNYELLSRLDYFKIFELPVLVGISRKSMINKVLGTKPANALNGSTVLHTIALLNGANILRVHDVKEAVEAIKIVEFYAEINNNR